MYIDFDVAYDKLAGLETADEIADLFRGYGIKARPRNSSQCAISKWMAAQTGMKIVTNNHCTRAVDSKYAVINGLQRNNSDPMRNFIRHFDSNGYPDLVGERYAC